MSTESVVARRIVLADLVPGSLVRDAVLVLAGAGLTGLAAQVSIPLGEISPVPVTGQTFAVLLAGAALGPLRGLASMLLYLLAGVAGVPWFAGGESGAGGPAFGYLIGFVVAGAIVGELARRGGDRTPVRTVATMVLGNLAIYAFGVGWLITVTGMTPGDALYKGAVIFFIGDAIKIALAAGLLPGSWRLVQKLSK